MEKKSNKKTKTSEKLAKRRVEGREKVDILALILPVIAAGIDRIATVMEKSSDTAAAVQTKRLEVIGAAGEAGVVEMLKAETLSNKEVGDFLNKAIETAKALGNRRMDILEKHSEVLGRAELIRANAEELTAKAELLEAQAKLEEAQAERLDRELKRAELEDNKKGNKKAPFIDLSAKD